VKEHPQAFDRTRSRTARCKKQRQCLPKLIARMVVHIEADDKGGDWPLKVDAEEETPEQLIASRMKQRPGGRDEALTAIAQACADTASIALVGAPVEGQEGRVRISTLQVDGDRIEVAYRKSYLGGDEPARFSPGEGHMAVDLDGWRIGLGVCKDTGVDQHIADTGALNVGLYAAGLVHLPRGAGHAGRACPPHRYLLQRLCRVRELRRRPQAAVTTRPRVSRRSGTQMEPRSAGPERSPARATLT
jgi:hypothetical protein